MDRTISQRFSRRLAQAGFWAAGLGLAASAQAAAISGALPQWLPTGSLDPVLKAHAPAIAASHAAAAQGSAGGAPLQLLSEPELASLPLPAGGALLPPHAGAAAVAVRAGRSGEDIGACTSTDCPQVYAPPLAVAGGTESAWSGLSWSVLEGQLFGTAASGPVASPQPVLSSDAGLTAAEHVRQGGVGLAALSLVLLLLGTRRVLEIRRQRHGARPAQG